MLEEISRRGFVQKALIGTMSLLMGCAGSKEKDPRYTYNLTQKFQKNGINPIIWDNEGTRTLIQIGETHEGYGDEYVKFFKNLEGRIDFDVIFMENVYSDKNRKPNPYIAMEMDKTKISGRELSIDNVRTDDKTGYFRLSEKYKVQGIEDDNLDHQILWTMLEMSFTGLYPLTGEFSNGKSPAGEVQMNSLASKLKKANFAQRSYPNRDDRAEIKKLRGEIKKELAKSIYQVRNQYFAQYIDRNLRHYTIGALIIGRGHIFPSDTQGAETLETYFRDKKINGILLNIEQVKEFNKNFGSKNQYGKR